MAQLVEQRTFVRKMVGNTAVKRLRMPKWIFFLPAARQFPAQNFKGKHCKTTGVTQNLRNKIEMFIEICKRKQEKVKGKLSRQN